MKQFLLLFSFLALAFAFALTGCKKKPAEPIAQLAPSKLVERGKSIYLSNCIACHNPNPTKDGFIGPSVAGSSLALLEERILRSSYPLNYKPKRQTKTMTALPFLEKEIPALAAYLSSLPSDEVVTQ